MNFSDLFGVLFFCVFAAVAGMLVYKYFKYGGFKAALFDAPIERTVGEVNGARGCMIGSKVRVHILGGGAPERAVGLELVAKGIASYQMMPISFSVTEANSLIMLLQAAVNRR